MTDLSTFSLRESGPADVIESGPVPRYPLPAPPRSFAESVRRIEGLHRIGPWDELRRLFHDDARLQSQAAGGVYGSDQTVAAMRKAARNSIYSMGAWTKEAIEPDAVLVSARMRHVLRSPSGPDHGVSDQRYFWLMTGRESLLWRMRIFGTREDALDFFAENGLSLGM